MTPVYLALGSNLGDREKYLRAAVTGLAAWGIHIVRCASLYSTEPQEMVDQPWFLNTAIEVSTEAEAAALLEICLNIEKENHRTRQVFKGSRTLDIDILFYGSRIIHESCLTIPHPSLAARRFVLAPLAEIAPDFVHPATGQSIRELLQSCPDQSAVQIVGTL